MRSTDPALLAIEVQPRYRDLLSGHWPVVAGPEPDELLSSWLHRQAVGNGLPPKAFGPALDLGSGALVRPNRSRAAGVRAGSGGPLHGPHSRGGRRHDARRGWCARALVAVARRSPGRRGRRQAAWLQFCPQCLAEDEQPYFRRQWCLATTIVCARHASRLLDRWPACGPALAPFNQASLRPQNDCAAPLSPASRRGRPTRGRKFGGPRPTRDGRKLRPRRRHPRSAGEARSAASGGVDGAFSVRSRPRPACAGRRNRSAVRRRDQRGRQSKAACRKSAGGARGVLACVARGLCGRTPAARRPHLKRSPQSGGNRPKPHPPRARPLRP